MLFGKLLIHNWIKTHSLIPQLWGLSHHAHNLPEWSKKWSSCIIAHYLILRIAICAFTLHSLVGLSIEVHLDFSGKLPAMLQLMHKNVLHKYPPQSIARYLFIQLSELEQCRVKNPGNMYSNIYIYYIYYMIYYIYTYT